MSNKLITDNNNMLIFPENNFQKIYFTIVGEFSAINGSVQHIVGTLSLAYWPV